MQMNKIPSNNSLPEEKFLRLPQVLALFPVSRSSWYAGIKAGIYPHGYKLGKRTTAWKISHIAKLLENGGRK